MHEIEQHTKRYQEFRDRQSFAEALETKALIERLREKEAPRQVVEQWKGPAPAEHMTLAAMQQQLTKELSASHATKFASYFSTLKTTASSGDLNQALEMQRKAVALFKYACSAL